MCIPDLDHLLHGETPYNHANWRKHRGEEGVYVEPFEFHDRFVDKPSISRSMIFCDFKESIACGIVSALMWGFPRGRFPGGRWRPIADAFRSQELRTEIQRLQAAQGLDATEIITCLNGVIGGLSTASTSKLAYFACLQSQQGPCLILDSRVIAAIRRIDTVRYPELTGVKQMLGGGENLQQAPTPAQVIAAYGPYLEAVRAYVARRGNGTREDQIEFALFLSNRNPNPCLE